MDHLFACKNIVLLLQKKKKDIHLFTRLMDTQNRTQYMGYVTCTYTGTNRALYMEQHGLNLQPRILVEKSLTETGESGKARSRVPMLLRKVPDMQEQSISEHPKQHACISLLRMDILAKIMVIMKGRGRVED